MSCAFDFSGVDDFDEHIRMSIPDYDSLFNQVVSLVECLSQDDSSIVDIGCATGKLLHTVEKRDARYYAIDKSDLIDTYRTDTRGVNLIKDDFFAWDLPDDCSVITSLFFLQFLSRVERAVALERINDVLIGGGCFIVAEKVYADSPLLENVLTATHMQEKLKNFTANDIMEKNTVLARAMSLSTESQLRTELEQVGTPYLLWKSYGFTAYVVIAN